VVSRDSTWPALWLAASVGVRARIGFAPVRIAANLAPASVAHRGAIEIEFATGARMRITGAVETGALAAAVAVLAEGRRR
jgi:transposase